MRSSKFAVGLALALLVGCAQSGLGAGSSSDDDDSAGGAGGSEPVGAAPAVGGAMPAAQSSSSSASVAASSSSLSATSAVASSSSSGGSAMTPGTCFDPLPLTLGTPVSDTTVGAPNQLDSSCGAGFLFGTGPELVYAVTPPDDATLELILASPCADLGVSVRTNCTDVLSELGCVDLNTSGTNEELYVEVSAGTEIFIVVDGYASFEAGSFTLSVAELPPESICDDLDDSDHDTLVDCADDDCAPLAACVPGSEPVGNACTSNTDCASVAGDDPLCLTETLTQQPNGYCSEFCDTANDDCGSEGICTTHELSGSKGVCLATCTANTDCRAEYSCQDIGLLETVCQPESCNVGTVATLGVNTGNTATSFASNKEGSCISGSEQSPEQVFVYSATQDGTLTITLTSDPTLLPDLGFSVRTTCSDSATETACQDTNIASTPETADIQVTNGQDYTILVDGFLGDAGPFELELELN